MPSIARTARTQRRRASTGADAEKLLQDLVTNDLDLLRAQRAVHAALLSPQGKILFEFMVVPMADGFVLETGRARAADLVKRLGLYKLRAKVEIADRGDEHGRATPHGATAARGDRAGCLCRPAARRPRLAPRAPARHARRRRRRRHPRPTTRTASRWACRRPDKDYALGDTFPHEAVLRPAHGVSFDKGCFIGQEVVSRMQHRGTARKRFVHGARDVGAAAAPRTPSRGRRGGHRQHGLDRRIDMGLALVRLDRAAEALAKGHNDQAGERASSRCACRRGPPTRCSTGAAQA